MEEEEQQQKKISLPEAILMIMICGLADLFELIATFVEAVPVIGQILLFIKWFVAIFSWLAIQFWLIMKGVSIRWFLGGSGIELIPIVNALPVRLAALAMTLIEDNKGGQQAAPADKSTQKE